jgi:phospholipase C
MKSRSKVQIGLILPLDLAFSGAAAVWREAWSSLQDNLAGDLDILFDAKDPPFPAGPSLGTYFAPVPQPHSPAATGKVRPLAARQPPEIIQIRYRLAIGDRAEAGKVGP